MKGKWMYQFGESEIWRGEEFESKEDAIKQALEEMKEDEELKKLKLYVGQQENVLVSGIDVDLLLENVAENTTCEVGEVGEDYLTDVTKEEQEELEEKLNEVFFDWIEKYKYNPSFFRIVNIEEVLIFQRGGELWDIN